MTMMTHASSQRKKRFVSFFGPVHEIDSEVARARRRRFPSAWMGGRPASCDPLLADLARAAISDEVILVGGPAMHHVSRGEQSMSRFCG